MSLGDSPSSQPQSQTITQTNLPEYARPYYEDILQRGQAESYRSYTPYSAPRIANFTPEQVGTRNEVLGMTTPSQFGAAQLGTTAGVATGLNTANQGLGAAFSDPSAFMSPYMQNVVDVQKQQAIRDAEKAQLGVDLSAAKQGTYGGSRQLLERLERERALKSQLEGIQAKGLQSAYDSASARMGQLGQLGIQGLQAGLGGSQQLGNLGAQQQQADLSRIQAQSAAGAEQRQYNQQLLDMAYADFLRQRDYPMEQLNYYSNLLRGTPVQLGSTATSYAQPPSMTSQLGGLGLAGLGLYNLAKG